MTRSRSSPTSSAGSARCGSTCSSAATSARRELDAGERPDFLAGTREIREADWTVAPAPADFDDRRVEITGPAEPKMMINALNSGARVFMADLEDALSPTWANVVGGQAALIDAVRGTLDVRIARGQVLPAGRPHRARSWSGRAAGTSSSRTCSSTACRCRRQPVRLPGCTCSTTPPSGWRAGVGPYLYLPKLESHHEARLWNEVFVHGPGRARRSRAGRSGRRSSSRRSLAAFEMDEILYELREHAAGLNAGRWDYLFSVHQAASARARRWRRPIARS